MVSPSRANRTSDDQSSLTIATDRVSQIRTEAWNEAMRLATDVVVKSAGMALIYPVLRVGDAVPAFSDKDAERKIKRLAESAFPQIYFGQLLKDLHAQSLTQRRRIAVRNSKGGVGKTPVASNLAAIMSWVIKAAVALVDVNENDGSTAQQIGIERDETVNLTQAIHEPWRFRKADTVFQLMRPEKYNVYVMSSAVTPDHSITAEQVRQTILRLYLNGMHSSVADGGNGNSHPSNVGAVDAATTLVIPALEGDSLSYERVLSTMLYYSENGYEDLVSRAFIVISATKPGSREDLLPEYVKLLEEAAKVKVDTANGGKRQLTLEEFNIKPERIFLIPFDQHIKDRQIVDHEAISRETLTAYLELLVAIFSQEIPAEDMRIEDPDAFDFASAVSSLQEMYGLPESAFDGFKLDATRTDADNLMALISWLATSQSQSTKDVVQPHRTSDTGWVSSHPASSIAPHNGVPIR